MFWRHDDWLARLSVILSIGGLVALAVLCQRTAEVGEGQSTSNRGGTLLAVVLAALLVPQVEAGGTARMYGLGTLLNLTTALLLWRLIANNKAYRINLWSLYGMAAAAACGTHYFSFFNLLAQGIFVSGLCLNWTRLGLWRQALEIGGGWLYAMALAALLFAPWLPTLLAQTRQVQEGWWVPPVTLGNVDRIGLQWLTGDVSPGPPTMPGSFLAVVMVVLVCWTLWRGKMAAWFFFLQAFVPWAVRHRVFAAWQRQLVAIALPGSRPGGIVRALVCDLPRASRLAAQIAFLGSANLAVRCRIG